MNHMALGGSLALLACVGAANAGFSGTLTELHSQKVEGNSAYETVISLPAFDDRGGTRQLMGVCLDFEFESSALVTAENDAATAAPSFTLNLAGTVSVAFAGLEGTAELSKQMVESVGVSDGVPGSGADFMDYGSVIRAAHNTCEQDADLGAFIGTGAINALIRAEAGFFVTGTSDATIRTNNFHIVGGVSVVYSYRNIPAPGATALGAFALMGAMRRRR